MTFSRKSGSKSKKSKLERAISQVPTIQDYAERLQTLKQSNETRHRTIDGQDIAGDPMSPPLLTIVTVAFNSAATIERTISSIVGQTYRRLEYIVIDGGSTDDTVGIIRRWAQYISYWHSAKDCGISDAFNLGIAAAHGKYIGMVNSDDWMSTDQSEVLVAALERTGAAFAFGRLAHHASNDALLYYTDGASDYGRDIRWRMPHINHPTVIYRRSIFDSVGLFDLRCRLAMDYDWHLRAELKGIRGIYVSTAIGHMTEGGASELGWDKGLREVRDIAVRHTKVRFIPNLYYRIRLIRGLLRLAMSRIAPKWFVDVVHRAINPRYKPVRSRLK